MSLFTLALSARVTGDAQGWTAVASPRRLPYRCVTP